ncbi:MAG: helix-turn-helix domain-containing protein [Solirubrobacteraceae bacterium]|jgi:excisionase family DNA binding protein
MPPRTTFEELLTVGEVAETLRYSEGTVRHWIRTGKLPAIQVTGGREYRIRLPDFLAFAEGLGIPVRVGGAQVEAQLEDEPLTARLRRTDER